jgi:hypothetical protein
LQDGILNTFSNKNQDILNTINANIENTIIKFNSLEPYYFQSGYISNSNYIPENIYFNINIYIKETLVVSNVFMPLMTIKGLIINQ